MSEQAASQRDVSVPVCPACRATIALEAHACARCGLAVRPTCSNCGEPLEVRMHACPRCWEVIDNTMGFSEGTMVYDPPAEAAPAYEHRVLSGVAAPVAAPVAASVATPTLTQEMPVNYPAPPAPATRIRFGRILLLAVLAGLLLAVGLLLLETYGPQLRGQLPTQVRLERESFADLKFAIGVPEGWDMQRESVGSRPAVAVREPADGGDASGLREFKVIVVNRTLVDARIQAERRAPASARNYTEIDIVDGLRLDGRVAFRHLYTDDDVYREDWWVKRGNGTYRLEFYGPVSRREESAQLNVRIARTFDEL